MHISFFARWHWWHSGGALTDQHKTGSRPPKLTRKNKNKTNRAHFKDSRLDDFGWIIHHMTKPQMIMADAIVTRGLRSILIGPIMNLTRLHFLVSSNSMSLRHLWLLSVLLRSQEREELVYPEYVNLWMNWRLNQIFPQASEHKRKRALMNSTF